MQLHIAKCVFIGRNKPKAMLANHQLVANPHIFICVRRWLFGYEEINVRQIHFISTEKFATLQSKNV